jgi:PTS system mannitol-specific IIC component
VKERIQLYGGYLAAMVLPNIGAILAWGLITAFVIPTGWTPNETLAALVGPMITYLLPILIGFTGGKLVYGHRGGVVAAVATTGIIVGSDVPMFLGAMIVGPIAAWLIKKYDDLTGDKIPSGFEMLSNNFSSGILGAVLAVIGVLAIGPILQAGSDALGAGVDAIIAAGLLPFADIPIEVGKVLFLNNAINHGVLAPRDPLPARDEPGSGARAPARLRVRRQGHGQAVRAGRDHHPLLRRDPRDLLPVRARPPDHDRGHVGRRDRRGLRLRCL